MPQSNTNRLVAQDMATRLLVAEKRIAEFQPPSAGPDPPPDPPSSDFRPDIHAIQQEIATFSAQERTEALFGFLVELITQTCKDEIAREQIVAALGTLQRDMRTVQDILARNNLT